MIHHTLMLDGFLGRPRRFARLQRVIESHGGTAEIFRYDATGLGALDTEGEKLASAIRDRGQPVNLVAFSMGGLVVRAAHQIDPSLPIERAVFLNSPHQGSWWCNFARPFKIFRALRQMVPGSDFLSKLAAIEWKIPTLTIWCPFDLAVFPGHLGKWSASQTTICSAVPIHPWPVYSRSIHRRIISFLED